MDNVTKLKNKDLSKLTGLFFTCHNRAYFAIKLRIIQQYPHNSYLIGTPIHLSIYFTNSTPSKYCTINSAYARCFGICIIS
jgi:hypothetical protein